MSTRTCALLARAGRGERDAFAGVYDDTVEAVHLLALCLTRDPDDAVELTRLSYLEAWRTAPRFAPDRVRALPWLLATVQRVAAETSVGAPEPGEG